MKKIKGVLLWWDKIGRECEDGFVWIWGDECVYFFE